MAKKAKTKKPAAIRTPTPEIPPILNDDENISEAEANAMVDESIAQEKAELKKLENEIDSQDWTLADPVIPDALKDEVWVAVYKCVLGHKTKATNRQAKGGVRCWRCKEEGKTVKAEIMMQFLVPPESGDPDVDKRRRARKGSE